MLRRLVVIATFFVFLFTGLKQNNVTTETYAYSEVMSEEDNTKATVTIYFMLKNGEGSGTGVVWDITEEGKLIILTAKHCVDYDEPSIIAVVFDN